MTKTRIITITMALALTLSLLAGCSSVPGMGGSSSGGQSDQSSQSTPDVSSSADVSSSEDAANDGPYYIGDTISTAWFDFTVDSVDVQSEYEGYAAAEGNKLLVVQLSLKSTVTYSSDMFQEDFVVGWDDEEDEEYGYDYVEPLSAYCDAQFPDEYVLKINESRTGLLIYEVSAERMDFWINFLEVFQNDQYGDSFFVYFSAE